MRNKKCTNLFYVQIFIVLLLFLLAGCASIQTILPKTQSINVPELTGEVLITSMRYVGSRYSFTQTTYVTVTNPSKELVILRIQMKNVIRNYFYDLTPIVLLDGETRIHPGSMCYSRKNSIYVSGIEELNPFIGLLFKSDRNGSYNIDLVYAIDKGTTISKIDIYGNIIDFDI